MPRKPTGNPSGPPPKQVDYDNVLHWIELQATAEEIATSFHMTVDTLDARLNEKYGMGFSELRKRVNGGGKISLRRYQFKQAETNGTMAIWLGKQWLGQRDHDEVKDSTPPAQQTLELQAELMLAKAKIKQLESVIHQNPIRIERQASEIPFLNDHIRQTE